MSSSWVSQFSEMPKGLSTIFFRSSTPNQVSHLFLVGVPWGLLSVCPMVHILPPSGACTSCPDSSYPSETVQQSSPTCLLALLYPVLPGKSWLRLLLAFPFSLLPPAPLCGLKGSQSRKTSPQGVSLWMNRKSQWVSGQ